MKTKILLALGALGGAALSAHADTRIGIGLHIGIPAPVIVREAPPPQRVIVERRVAAPAPGYVWIPAHYVWEGRWTWVEGSWALPPETGAVWVEGRWDGRSQQWVEGHWETAAVSMPPPPPPGSPVVGSSAEIYINDAPPPPRHEERGRPPGRGYVWISGYWNWRGGRHVWEAGHWDRPPRGHSAWVEPRWENRGHGYVFVQGYWRLNESPDPFTNPRVTSRVFCF